jgi:predicted ATPase
MIYGERTLTSSDSSKSRELADIVYQKTKGNVFFAIQLLKNLQRKGYLYMNLATGEFEYDATKIRAATSVADNVVDLVAGNFKMLPRNTEEVFEGSILFGFSL